MRRYPELKKWEMLLIALGALLFVSSAALYLSDVSLRKVLLGWEDESGKEQVGHLALRSGVIRRQFGTGSEFQAIDRDAALFNYDTLVTGPDATATIQLDDESKIELGANTMVRLAFETKYSLGGISRAATVQVVSGKVSGQSAPSPKMKVTIRTRDREFNLTPKLQTVQSSALPPSNPIPKPSPVAVVAAAAPSPRPSPSPSPSPLPSPSPSPSPSPKMIMTVAWVAPKNGSRLSVAEGSQLPEKQVTLQWKCPSLNAHYDLVLTKKGSEDEIYRERIDLKDGGGRRQILLRSPGEYLAVMNPIDGEKTSSYSIRTLPMSFFVNAQFEGIQLLPHLVGGREMDSSAYRGSLTNDFDITLRWKPYPGAEKYTVQLLKSPSGQKPLLKKEVTGEHYSFNKDKIYVGTIYYSISTRLKSGFIATSKPQAFRFNFLAPVLVAPADQVHLSLKRSGKTILFTWQKTNFTEAYELEIATDESFTQVILKQRLKENFYLLRAPKAATYWWRVKSYSKDLVSPPSGAFTFTVDK